MAKTHEFELVAHIHDVSSVGAAAPTAAYQVISFGSTIAGGDATGLENDSTAYTMTVTVDGVAKAVSVAGSAAQTYTTLISQINTDLGASATAAIASGAIKITSATTGASSAVSIVDGTLVAALTPYATIETAVANTQAKAVIEHMSINGVDVKLTDTVSGYQVVTMGTPAIAGNATGLANDSTAYTATIWVDGVAYPISVVGSAAQTFTALLAEVNTDLDGAAVMAIDSGNLKVTSASAGADSTVAIVDGTLLDGLTGTITIETAVAGSGELSTFEAAVLQAVKDYLD